MFIPKLPHLSSAIIITLKHSSSSLSHIFQPATIAHHHHQHLPTSAIAKNLAFHLYASKKAPRKDLSSKIHVFSHPLNIPHNIPSSTYSPSFIIIGQRNPSLTTHKFSAQQHSNVKLDFFNPQVCWTSIRLRDKA